MARIYLKRFDTTALSFFFFVSCTRGAHVPPITPNTINHDSHPPLIGRGRGRPLIALQTAPFCEFVSTCGQKYASKKWRAQGKPLGPLLVEHSPRAVRAGNQRILAQRDARSAVAAEIGHDGAGGVVVAGVAADSGSAGGRDLVFFARHVGGVGLYWTVGSVCNVCLDLVDFCFGARQVEG